MGRLRSTLVILSVAVTLAACGGSPQTDVAAPPSATPLDTTTPLDTAATTTEPSPIEDPTPDVEVTTKAPARVAAPYTFNCWLPESADEPQELTVHSLAEVWRGKLETCEIVAEAKHKPTRTERKALALYKTFNAEETTEGALEIMLGICAEPADYAEGETVMWTNNVMGGAALLCPKAPHAAVLRARGSGNTFDDGTYVVGTEVNPGTYRTDPGVRDCYWERTTGGGDTIANDFVTFASRGATVTIRKSDGGFTSTDCGPWKRVS